MAEDGSTSTAQAGTDGGAASSPPTDSTPATGVAVQDSSGDSASSDQGVDKHAVFQRLQAEADGESDRTSDEPASPEPAVNQVDHFQDLPAKDRDSLKRAGLVVAPEIWGAMPVEAKSALVRQATTFLSNKERAFQQAQAAEQQARQIQQQPQQTIPVTAPQMAPKVADSIKAIQDKYGTQFQDGEQFAGMMGTLMQAQEAQLTQQFSQQHQQLAQQMNAVAEMASFLIGRLEQTERKQSMEKLKTDFGTHPKFAEQSPAVEAMANALLQAHWNSGNRAYTLEQAVLDAGRSVFHEFTQQQAQLKLAKSRQRSLDGTFARSNASSASPRTPLGNSKREIFQRLAQGESPEAIRNSMG